jgi:DNA modification methylase
MIIRGDCLEKLKELADNSVDACVCDPPYGLKFMGKKWDYEVPSIDIWRECLRVLKPGAHLLSFGGTRTYHRMVVAIEDAGFEIRDQLQWLFGSGFPKSLDISKAIDKMHGAEREVVETRIKNTGTHYYENGAKMGRANYGVRQGDSKVQYENIELPTTAPATDDAKQWQGFGTALKPANEPIVLARKPLSEKTVALNVLKWGTGGLNIDASRIGSEPVPCQVSSAGSGYNKYDASGYPGKVVYQTQGRFPANILLDEEAAEMLDEQSGNAGASGGASRFFYVAKASKRERNAGLEGMSKKLTGTQNEINLPVTGNHGQTGKLNKPMEPQQNFHPTVKPIKLMQYLIRLITPPNGIVLDPFMGSGSTGVAAKSLGFEFIGIELNEEYCEIAERRMAFDTQYK